MTYETIYRQTCLLLADLRAQDFTEGESEWQEKLETILNELFAHLHPIIERSKPKEVEPVDFTEALTQLLTEFLRVSGVKKKTFAQAYGCRPEHISRLLNGNQEINIYKLSDVLHSLGYGLKVDVNQVEIVRL